jgi:hypothetical protein
MPQSAVSQSAKTCFPTLKPFATNGLEVRQPEAIFLHTPAHAGAGVHAHAAATPMTIGAAAAAGVAPEKITSFIATVHSLYPQYRVCFTTHPLLKTRFSDCDKAQLNLFLELVQTFALLHHAQRKTDVENVLAACDSDYTEAFQLWQHCQPKPKHQQPVYQPTLQRVLQLLQYRYENKPFNCQKIATQLNLNPEYIRKFFVQLQQENRISYLRTEASTGERFFKLIPKNPAL